MSRLRPDRVAKIIRMAMLTRLSQVAGWRNLEGALLAAPEGVRDASGSRKRLPSTAIRPATVFQQTVRQREQPSPRSDAP